MLDWVATRSWVEEWVIGFRFPSVLGRTNPDHSYRNPSASPHGPRPWRAAWRKPAGFLRRRRADLWSCASLNGDGFRSPRVRMGAKTRWLTPAARRAGAGTIGLSHFKSLRNEKTRYEIIPISRFLTQVVVPQDVLSCSTSIFWITGE